MNPGKKELGMFCKSFIAMVVMGSLSACTVFIPKATEPSEGPRARIRVIGASGELIVTPEKQPGGRHGGFVGHDVLYPGTRHKLGMPDREKPTRWADEYYVVADQNVHVYYHSDIVMPGNKYSPGTHNTCGNSADFHVDEGADYEVSVREKGFAQGCVLEVMRIVNQDGKTQFLPVLLKPHVYPKAVVANH
jgi:hypothetical protein